MKNNIIWNSIAMMLFTLSFLTIIVRAQAQGGIQLPGGGAVPVDVYFLADNTGSMLQEITSVREEAKFIFNSLAAQASSDIRFGVGAYKDVGDNFVYQNLLSLTDENLDVPPSEDPIVIAMGQWEAEGGGDKPEGQLFALYEIAVTQYEAIGWRGGDTVKIVIWFGDAPGKDPFGRTASREPITEQFVTQALVEKGIRVSAFDAADLNGSGQAARIANATNGELTLMTRMQIDNTIPGPSPLPNPVTFPPIVTPVVDTPASAPNVEEPTPNVMQDLFIAAPNITDPVTPILEDPIQFNQESAVVYESTFISSLIVNSVSNLVEAAVNGEKRR
eukprot:TRINITY_DN3229_c0_g1_i2.p1 TRINITY_DN3229_c0_g1~~TRINITY_DN3229_c0_g1_i2.p1  ORF type:complete len:332 (-),score=52.64 TRINITY_DN3229_c0_g1_i2:757-1752(-)